MTPEMKAEVTIIGELFQDRENESWQWGVGDALVRLCGPPSTQGVNDGGYALIEMVKTHLETLEIERLDCSIRYLSMLRAVSYSFSERNRFRSLTWSIHLVAGTPEALNKIIDKLTLEGVKITKRNVAKALTQIKKDVAIFPEIKADYNTTSLSIDKINRKIAEHSATMSPEVMADIREECLSLIENARKALQFLGSSNERSHITLIGSTK